VLLSFLLLLAGEAGGAVRQLLSCWLWVVRLRGQGRMLARRLADITLQKTVLQRSRRGRVEGSSRVRRSPLSSEIEIAPQRRKRDRSTYGPSLLLQGSVSARGCALVCEHAKEPSS
jgi:hypothetical protein